jgi:hypothetical protein
VGSRAKLGTASADAHATSRPRPMTESFMRLPPLP